jgi:hypothetical protein
MQRTRLLTRVLGGLALATALGAFPFTSSALEGSASTKVVTGHPPERVVSAPADWSALRDAIEDRNRFYIQAASAPTPITLKTPKPEGQQCPEGGCIYATPSYEDGSLERLIMDIFGSAGHSAINVASCESTGGNGLNPSAVSRGGGNWGLFQINTVHQGQFETVTGHPWSEVLDAGLNTQFAKWLYDQSGWGPWACRWAA